MEKEYLIMDDAEYSYGIDVNPEPDDKSEEIIKEVMQKYDLKEEA